MKLLSLPLLLFCACAVGAPTAPVATPPSNVPAAIVQQAGISLDQAVAMVQARYRAKVMRANSVDEGGRVIHYIRLMSADGARVWTVRVDAASGREI